MRKIQKVGGKRCPTWLGSLNHKRGHPGQRRANGDVARLCCPHARQTCKYAGKQITSRGIRVTHALSLFLLFWCGFVCGWHGGVDLPRGLFLSGCSRAVCSDLSLLWRFFFPEPSGSQDSSLLPFCPTCLGLGRRGSLPKTSVVIRFRVSLSLLVSGFGRRLPGLGDPTGGRPASWSSPGPSRGPRPGGTHGAQAPVRRTSGAQGTLKLPPGLAKTSLQAGRN